MTEVENKKIRLRISYEGTAYKGWQRQPDNPSVQEFLEKALAQYFDLEKVSCTASGRTDAGVHAEDQNVHFQIPQTALEKRAAFAKTAFAKKDSSFDHSLDFVHSVNQVLPKDIQALQAWFCPDDFHAKNSCATKRYRYQILNASYSNPFWRNYSLHIRTPLDIDLLNALSCPLIGTQDFKSFQTQGTPVKTSIRTITQAQWSQHPENPEVLLFLIEGSGFLKQMVRNIVGTLIHLEKIKASPDDTRAILEAKDRQKAYGTAQPQGLFLDRACYEPRLDRNCVKI